MTRSFGAIPGSETGWPAAAPGSGTGDVVAANNLSEYTATAATARGNIGLGTLATQSGTFSGTSSGTNTGDQTLVGLGGVPTTRTVAGHALSSDVAVSASDVGLGSVNNTADTAKPVSTLQRNAIQNALSTSSLRC